MSGYPPAHIGSGPPTAKQNLGQICVPLLKGQHRAAVGINFIGCSPSVCSSNALRCLWRPQRLTGRRDIVEAVWRYLVIASVWGRWPIGEGVGLCADGCWYPRSPYGRRKGGFLLLQCKVTLHPPHHIQQGMQFRVSASQHAIDVCSVNALRCSQAGEHG